MGNGSPNTAPLSFSSGTALFMVPPNLPLLRILSPCQVRMVGQWLCLMICTPATSVGAMMLEHLWHRRLVLKRLVSKTVLTHSSSLSQYIQVTKPARQTDTQQLNLQWMSNLHTTAHFVMNIKFTHSSSHCDEHQTYTQQLTSWWTSNLHTTSHFVINVQSSPEGEQSSPEGEQKTQFPRGRTENTVSQRENREHSFPEGEQRTQSPRGRTGHSSPEKEHRTEEDNPPEGAEMYMHRMIKHEQHTTTSAPPDHGYSPPACRRWRCPGCPEWGCRPAACQTLKHITQFGLSGLATCQHV